MANGNLQNVLGNSIDINLGINTISNYSEIRADIPVSQYQALRVWGQVRDTAGNPIPYALLKLVRSTNGSTYSGIAHTTADCQGFYQFDLCPENGAQYKILASKSATGAELTMQPSGSCPPDQANYDPCSNNSTFSISNCCCGN